MRAVVLLGLDEANVCFLDFFVSSLNYYCKPNASPEIRHGISGKFYTGVISLRSNRASKACSRWGRHVQVSTGLAPGRCTRDKEPPALGGPVDGSGTH
jgi:hypothetical protein